MRVVIRPLMALALLLVLASGLALAAIPQELAPLAKAYGDLSTFQATSKQQLSFTTGQEVLQYTRQMTLLWDESEKFFLGDSGIFAPNLASDGTQLLLSVARAGVALTASCAQVTALADDYLWALMMPISIPTELDLHLLSGGALFEGATVSNAGEEELAGVATTKYEVVLPSGDTATLWVNKSTGLLQRWAVHSSLPMTEIIVQLPGAETDLSGQSIALDFVADYTTTSVNEALPEDFAARLGVPDGLLPVPFEQLTPPDPSASAPDDESGEIAATGEVLDFSIKLMGGDTLKLAAVEGPVIVDFFSTGCGPCKNAIPHLRELGDKYADQGLKVVVLALDPTLDSIKSFFKSEKTLLVGFDPDKINRLASEFNVTSIPRTLYLDADHKVVSESLGYYAGMDFTSHLVKMGINP